MRRHRRGRQTTRRPVPHCCSALLRPLGCLPFTAWAILPARAQYPCQCRVEAARTHCSTTTAYRTPYSIPCLPTLWTWAPRALAFRAWCGDRRGGAGERSVLESVPSTRRPPRHATPRHAGTAELAAGQSGQMSARGPSGGFLSNKLLLRSFRSQGLGLEPGKGINYKPQSPP